MGSNNSELNSSSMSPVISVVILVAIVISIAALSSVFVFDIGSSATDKNQPGDFSANYRQTGSGTVTATILKVGGGDKVSFVVDGEYKKNVTNFNVGDSIELSNLDKGSKVSLVVNKQVYETITIGDGADSPTVTIDSVTPSNPDTGETIQFNSTGSDPDGTIQEYNWSFDDGNSTTGQNVTHSYSSSGTYTVTVTVTDDDGRTATDSTDVTVGTKAPSVTIDSVTPNPANTSETIQFNSTGSDPDGTIQEYNWSFDDGSSTTGQNVTHSYSNDGSYDVTVTVTDNDSATDSDSVTVTVQNQEPTANYSYSPETADVGETVDFTAENSSDSDGSISSYEWNFDDGSPNATGENVSHSFSSGGSYNVTLTVTDNDGATDSITKTVDVLTTSQNGFIMTVNSTQGVTKNDTFSILTSGNQEYVVEGDVQGGSYTCSFKQNCTVPVSNNGTNTLIIRGSRMHITYTGGALFSNTTDVGGINTVEQWGDIKWSSFDSTFRGAGKLVINATDNPDLSNVRSMESMFELGYKPTSNLTVNYSINDWNTSNVRNMRKTFRYASQFNGDISGWEMKNVKYIDEMFSNAYYFNQSLDSWNTSSVISMNRTFRNAINFDSSIDWNTKNVRYMVGVFELNDAFNHPSITYWNTGNVTTMKDMFAGSGFNQQIGAWDTSNVTTMNGMFSAATSFDQDLSSWDTGNVTNMESMFFQASDFNGSVESWDTSNVTTMKWMFQQASSFNSSIGSWNTGNVTNMKGMFSSGSQFNRDISSWDTSSVTTMNDMFNNNENFSQNISDWNTGNVTDMEGMFASATSFNHSLNKWDTSSVTNMDIMFLNAESFNSSIDKWDTSNVTSMERMFKEAANFDRNISTWCVEQIDSKPSQFDYLAGFDGESSKQPNWGESC